MNKHPKLEKLRRKKLKLDLKLLGILTKRFVVVKQIGHYKKKNGLDLEDKKEERFMMKTFKKAELSFGFVKRLFRVILDESKRIMKNE